MPIFFFVGSRKSYSICRQHELFLQYQLLSYVPLLGLLLRLINDSTDGFLMGIFNTSSVSSKIDGSCDEVVVGVSSPFIST